MSIKILPFLLTVFGLHAATAVGGDFPYEKYIETTLAERDKELSQYIDHFLADDVPLEKTKVVLSAQRFSARVKYVAEPRPMSTEKFEWLVNLGESLPFNKSFWPLFTHEIAISENDNIYWLPIQGALVESLIPDLTPSMELTIYFINLGASSGNPLYLITAVTTH